MIRVLMVLLILLLSFPASAFAVAIQLGVSDDEVPISSNFSGKQITVFGALENPDASKIINKKYHIVIEVVGPQKDMVMRRKERVFGIWINRQTRHFAKVPQFYLAVSNKDFHGNLPKASLKDAHVGTRHLNINLLSRGKDTYILPAPQFSNALRRLKSNSGLYSENDNALHFISPTLFRASIYLPANVPLGQYNVEANLFDEGRLVAKREASFRIKKTGFEQWIYDFAYNHGFLYGVVAVLLAMATGWTANAVFKKD